jgi:tricorn protease-like protein
MRQCRCLKVVYERDYQIYILDTQTESLSSLQSISSVIRSFPWKKTSLYAGKISDFDVSPDQKKIAFISRGELFVSDIGANSSDRSSATSPDSNESCRSMARGQQDPAFLIKPGRGISTGLR